MSEAISTRMPSVAIEYDLGKKRVAKLFTSPHEAKRFYTVKLIKGKNPKVLKDANT